MTQAAKTPEPAAPLTPAMFQILLALADGEKHGYAILKEVEEHTGGEVRLSTGTLYGIIKRLLGDFGPEMEEVFREQHASVRRRGDRIGILRLWWETITGIFRTAPREHFSMLHQDIRFAVRMMRKNAGYTVAAVLTLALGIGANTAIFSVIDAVLLRPLPYHKGHELVVLHQEAPKVGIDDMRFSVKE